MESGKPKFLYSVKPSFNPQESSKIVEFIKSNITQSCNNLIIANIGNYLIPKRGPKVHTQYVSDNMDILAPLKIILTEYYRTFVDHCKSNDIEAGRIIIISPNARRYVNLGSLMSQNSEINKDLQNIIGQINDEMKGNIMMMVSNHLVLKALFCIMQENGVNTQDKQEHDIEKCYEIVMKSLFKERDIHFNSVGNQYYAVFLTSTLFNDEFIKNGGDIEEMSKNRETAMSKKLTLKKVLAPIFVGEDFDENELKKIMLETLFEELEKVDIVHLKRIFCVISPHSTNYRTIDSKRAIINLYEPHILTAIVKFRGDIYPKIAQADLEHLNNTL